MKWAIEPWHDDNPERAVLVLKCGQGSTGECRIPIRKDRPASRPTWHWDGGNTVSPSINCSVCGFHKSLFNGQWQ
jgi:hypothetical protein